MQLPWQITQPCIPVRTWAGPLRPQVGAEVCNGDKDLPQECGSWRVIAVLRFEHLWESLAPSVQEAGLWPRDVLERFRATGVRPQWHDAPGGHRGILERRLSAPSPCVKGEDALALYGEMTRHQALKIDSARHCGPHNSKLAPPPPSPPPPQKKKQKADPPPPSPPPQAGKRERGGPPPPPPAHRLTGLKFKG